MRLVRNDDNPVSDPDLLSLRVRQFAYRKIASHFIPSLNENKFGKYFSSLTELMRIPAFSGLDINHHANMGKIRSVDLIKLEHSEKPHLGFYLSTSNAKYERVWGLFSRSGIPEDCRIG
jgi:hypothetical protein